MTPPVKQIDVSGEVLAQMSQRIKDINEGKEKVEKPTAQRTEPAPKTETPISEPIDEEPQMMDEPPMMDEGYDDYSEFDESESYDDFPPDEEDYELYEEPPEEEDIPFEPEKAPEPDEDERSTKLKAQHFNSLSEVSDYCVREFKVQRALAVTLVNKALQSNVDPEYRIDLAIKLFCKLFDTHKL